MIDLRKIVRSAVFNGDEVSLSLLSIESISKTLELCDLGKEVFDELIERADENIKVLIAINPYLTRKQWLLLLLNKSEIVSSKALDNDRYEASDYELSRLELFVKSA